MRPLLLLGHYLGFVLWLGAGIVAMQIGFVIRGAAREEVVLLTGLMARIYRAILLPGAVLTVLTGIMLTLRLYGGAVSAAGYSVAMMVMQGAGLLGAAIALGVSFPSVTRAARLDPAGPHREAFQRLRGRAAISGMAMGLLALASLIAGAMLP